MLFHDGGGDAASEYWVDWGKSEEMMSEEEREAYKAIYNELGQTEKAKEYEKVVSWGVHGVNGVLGSQEEKDVGKKIKSLEAAGFWDSTMNQNFGSDGSLKIIQMYIQIESLD